MPAGEFMMGSPTSERGRNQDEGPQRKVTFAQPFAVGKYEVTFAQWDACVAESGCTHKPDDHTWGRGKRPVINVSWNDAKQFVGLARQEDRQALPPADRGRMGVRGARRHQGVGRRTRPSRRARPSTTSRPTTTAISSTAAAPAGHLPPEDPRRRLVPAPTPSACTTCTATSGSGSRTATRTPTPAHPPMARPSRPRCTLNILRGGAWNYYPQLLRSAYRYASAPGVRTENTGFRVARSMQ